VVEIESPWTEYYRATKGPALAKTGLERGTQLVRGPGHRRQKQNSRLFRINSLGGKCSHVVDKYIGYTYPCLPVGLSCQKRRFWPENLSYFPYLYYRKSSYIQYKSYSFSAPEDDVKELIPPRAGRGGAWGHKSLPRYNL
jgi:hypothetical protein